MRRRHQGVTSPSLVRQGRAAPTGRQPFGATTWTRAEDDVGPGVPKRAAQGGSWHSTVEPATPRSPSRAPLSLPRGAAPTDRRGGSGEALRSGKTEVRPRLTVA